MRKLSLMTLIALLLATSGCASWFSGGVSEQEWETAVEAAQRYLEDAEAIGSEVEIYYDRRGDEERAETVRRILAAIEDLQAALSDGDDIASPRQALRSAYESAQPLIPEDRQTEIRVLAAVVGRVLDRLETTDES